MCSIDSLVNYLCQVVPIIDKGYTNGYTYNMKTAISIDKKLFEDAEKFSRTVGLSRSKLYCTAISEYIQNHSQDTITQKLNEFYKKNESRIDDGLKAAAYRLFDKEDW